MTREQLAELYGRHQGRALTEQDIAALGGYGGQWSQMSPQQFEQNVIFPSGEYKSRQNQLLRGEISAIYDPMLKASKASIGAQKGALGLDFEDLKKRLREVAGVSKAGLTESMSRYGLLRSGRTAAGIGKIQETLASDIGKADIQRTIAEANLTLQGAQFEADIRGRGLAEFEKLRPGSLEQQQLQLQRELQKFNIDINQFKTFTDFSANPFASESLESNRDLYRQLLEKLGLTVT